MKRLSRATLADLPASIERPAFDPASIGIGIVHLGLGAFQRAHMAAYLQPLLAHDPRWGVAGASLRSTDTRDALAPQDGLYALCEASGDGDRIAVMGGLRAIHGPADGDALMRQMVVPDTRIVSLTVTEKGYLRGSDGGLDLDDPAVRADLSGTAAPRTPSHCLVATQSLGRHWLAVSPTPTHLPEIHLEARPAHRNPVTSSPPESYSHPSVPLALLYPSPLRGTRRATSPPALHVLPSPPDLDLVEGRLDPAASSTPHLNRRPLVLSFP